MNEFTSDITPSAFQSTHHRRLYDIILGNVPGTRCVASGGFFDFNSRCTKLYGVKTATLDALTTQPYLGLFDERYSHSRAMSSKPAPLEDSYTPCRLARLISSGNL
jgi:hypothetical protein